MKKIHDRIEKGQAKCFSVDDQGTLWFGRCLVVSKLLEIRKKILNEAHDSLLSIHVGSTKMY